MSTRRARMNYAPQAVSCGASETSTFMKIFYAIIFLVVLGILGMCIAYINDRYTETYSSFRHVKRELSNIKHQMDGMKDDVQVALNQKDCEGNKLVEMETLLAEVKKNAQNCDTKGGGFVKNMFGGKSDLNEALVHYDADKTGRTDFALESAGGRIVTVKNCQNYRQESGWLRYILFPILPLCPANGARIMLQPGVLPGQCWAFKGDKCSVVIKLLGPVIIDSVSLEHLYQQISPTGDISSAPKDFTILGLRSSTDKNARELGKFTYCLEKPALQVFPIDKYCNETFNYVEMQIDSNHGNSEYTCVYRLRVHGQLNQTTSGGN